MGKLIIRNNGVETQLVNGVDFTTLSGAPDTYVIGIDTTSGSFEQLNPDGSIINYESSGGGNFTGGTVSGETFFANGLTSTSILATTISGGTVSGDGGLLGGVVGLSYSDLGFAITSSTPTTINQNVTLPYNSTVEYNGTLEIGEGYILVVPDGTSLTINP
jgi:hypothetical protein